MLQKVSILDRSDLRCMKCCEGFLTPQEIPICVQGALYHADCITIGDRLPDGVNIGRLPEWGDNQPAATIQPTRLTTGRTAYRVVVVRKTRGHTSDLPEYEILWYVGSMTYSIAAAREVVIEHARVFGLNYWTNPPRGLPPADPWPCGKVSA